MHDLESLSAAGRTVADGQDIPGSPDRDRAEAWEEYVEAVLEVVESIPPGRVMAYGQIAEYLGAGGPRQVARVLSSQGAPVPWWRVVTATGRLPPGHEQRARDLLRDEGTPLRGTGVDMRRATWDGRPVAP